MDVYVARQPIFDINVKIFGYELLYRRSQVNVYEGVDDDISTAELINNAFLAMRLDDLTFNTKAFINFSQKMIEELVPLMLPKDKVVIEVLENITMSEKLLNAVRTLKEKGYTIALDDFVFKKELEPLIELADIIKIEYDQENFINETILIEKYSNKVDFLAERIETREDFEKASKMGYRYFQGYFFSRPIVLKTKEVATFNTTLINVITELNKDEVNYSKVTNIIESDLGITYKILKLVNSVCYCSLYTISSIKQAIVRLGENELKKWIYLMLIKEVKTVENYELIRNSLIRAKFMEKLATEIGLKDKSYACFIIGMFSNIDAMLNRKKEDILSELPLDKDIKDTLLNKETIFRNIYIFAINYELFNTNLVDEHYITNELGVLKIEKIYRDSLKWVTDIQI